MTDEELALSFLRRLLSKDGEYVEVVGDGVRIDAWVGHVPAAELELIARLADSAAVAQ